MSFEGQVDWKRMLIGPWALTIAGKPSVAAPVVAATAPVKNLRRWLLIADLLLLWGDGFYNSGSGRGIPPCEIKSPRLGTQHHHRNSEARPARVRGDPRRRDAIRPPRASPSGS